MSESHIQNLFGFCLISLTWQNCWAIKAIDLISSADEFGFPIEKKLSMFKSLI